jgi:hypothetical protein
MTAAKVIKKAAARTEIWISSIRIPRASKSPFNSESFWVASSEAKAPVHVRLFGQAMRHRRESVHNRWWQCRAGRCALRCNFKPLLEAGKLIEAEAELDRALEQLKQDAK